MIISVLYRCYPVPWVEPHFPKQISRAFGRKASLEVDLEDSLLNSKDSSKFTGECVWKRWILMKEYIDKLFNENDEYAA